MQGEAEAIVLQRPNCTPKDWCSTTRMRGASLTAVGSRLSAPWDFACRQTAGAIASLRRRSTPWQPWDFVPIHSLWQPCCNALGSRAHLRCDTHGLSGSHDPPRRYAGQAGQLVNEFYVPVLGQATRYDRQAGYFDSATLVQLASGLAAFIRRVRDLRLLIVRRCA